MTNNDKLESIIQEIEDLGAFIVKDNKPLIEVKSDRLRKWSMLLDEVVENLKS